MFNNYSAHAGSLTREVGRTYWKKAMGSEYPLEIYNNKVYMDFSGDPGFYMYKFKNGAQVIEVGHSLNISGNFALYRGNISEGNYFSRDGAIRFGLFNSNNNPLTIDGLSNSGQLFRNYEGYATLLSPSRIRYSAGIPIFPVEVDTTAFAFRIRSKDPDPLQGTDLTNYGRLINSVQTSAYGNGASYSPTILSSDISQVTTLLTVSNGESINNNIFYYTYLLTVNRTADTTCQVTASVKSGESVICSTTMSHNFTSPANYYTFDNFVFRCNSATVETAIIKDLTITYI